MKKIWRFRVTDICNAHCFFCHGESATLTRKGIFMPITFLKSFLEKYVDVNDIVSITGGEPLLHPQIAEMITIVKNKMGSNFYLNTNGILLYPQIDKLLNAGLKDIHLNIATFEPSLYKKIYGIEIQSNYCNKIEITQKKGFNVRINCVVIKNKNDSEENILKMINKCNGISCDLAFIEEHTEYSNTEESKGLIFQNRFEIILLNNDYKLSTIEVGRKKYFNNNHSVIVAAPCAPHFAWNTIKGTDSFVVLENQQIKKFSNPQFIQL
jgi:molybdenum cofactor biosynthesis enzyme MoaA